MEVIKDIAAIIGLVLSIISLITICSKGGRRFIRSIFQKNTKDILDENKRQSQDIEDIKRNVEELLKKSKGHDEVSRQQCRDTLKNIYYKYQKDKKIPLYERKTADRTYEIYTKILDGNSYAQLLYNEICKWEIDTLSYQNLIED